MATLHSTCYNSFIHGNGTTVISCLMPADFSAAAVSVEFTRTGTGTQRPQIWEVLLEYSVASTSPAPIWSRVATNVLLPDAGAVIISRGSYFGGRQNSQDALDT